MWTFLCFVPRPHDLCAWSSDAGGRSKNHRLGLWWQQEPRTFESDFDASLELARLRRNFARSLCFPDTASNESFRFGPLFFGIDVESAATGRKHWDRAPCRCSVVSSDGTTLLDVHIAVPLAHLVSPLTEYTRMTVAEITGGRSLEAVRDMVRQHVGPHGILVGQSVHHDIEWLELRKGIDYGSCVDIAEAFAFVRPGET